MRSFFVTSVLMLLNIFSQGQRLFQDASGESNLFLGNDPFGWIFFNTSDKSASMGYTHYRKAGYDIPKWNSYFIYGGDIKVKVKDGFGNLISKGDFKPGLAVNGNFGIFCDSIGQGNFLNVYLRPGFAYNEYSYVNNSNNIPIAKDINKVESNFLINLNWQYNGVGKTYDPNQKKKVEDLNKHYNFFIGIQTGYKKLNNYNDLTEIEVRYRLFGNNDTSAFTTKKGKLGEYIGYNAIPLNIDLAVTPRIFETNIIGFNTFYRTNFLKDNNTHNAGFGIYLADAKKPNSIVGGLAWQFNDLSNELKKESSLLKRSTVFFYVGYIISGG